MTAGAVEIHTASEPAHLGTFYLSPEQIDEINRTLEQTWEWFYQRPQQIDEVTSIGNEVGATARHALKLGLSVVPPREDHTKAPEGFWKQYQERRATPEELDEWYGPHTGVGLVCGSISGGLEMTELEGRAVVAGMLDQLEETARDSGLHDLFVKVTEGDAELTPTGGIHWYTLCDSPLTEKLALMPGDPQPLCLAESKGEGGYSIIAPSGGTVHETGKCWRVHAGSLDTIPTLTDDEQESWHSLLRTLDLMPDREAFVPKESRTDDPTLPGNDYNARGPEWAEILEPHGWTHVGMSRGRDIWRRPDKRKGISASVDDTDRLRVWSTSTEFGIERSYSKFQAFTLLEHDGDFSAAARALREAGYGHVSRPANDVTARIAPYGRTSANQTVLAPNVGGVWSDERSIEETPFEDVEALDASDGFRMNDVGNSHRLIMYGGDKLRYVHAWGKWLIYGGGVYVEDEKSATITEFAKNVPQTMMDDLPPLGSSEENAQREKELKFAHASENIGRIQAMITLARGDPGVMVEHEMLNADPELLNVKNCTINLRTGEPKEHDPADLMTLQAPVMYDPTPRFEGSLWESCLQTWQPDPEIRHYLQVRAGACATGMATETFDVDYGEGGNGKSKFHGAIQHVLGPYAVVPNKSLLVNEKHEQHATVVASLFGARLAVAGEVESRCTLNEAMVKNITGGDMLRCRRMREDEWSFKPSHTMILFTNYKPIIKGTDQGIWRRVRLVPWEVTISEENQDARLELKLMAESSIILNWIVEGAQTFLNEGLTVPSSVRAATEEYRGDEDFVGRFLSECLSFENPTARTASAAITFLAEQWMNDQGVKWTLNPKALASALGRAGAKNIGRVMIGQSKKTTWQGVYIVSV